MENSWMVTFTIARQKANSQGILGPRYDQSYTLQVNPEEYVLDALERIWAFQDRSLMVRYACHHSTCGACGMLVNGREKLACITTLRSITSPNGHVRLEPLRNFPVVSDLVVDVAPFFQRMEQANFNQVADLQDAGLPYEKTPAQPAQAGLERLVDCIECGLCISACPPARTDGEYAGPAVLAAIQHEVRRTNDISLLELADSASGVWRCHSAFECTAVCPSNVDPAWRIMDLRRMIFVHRLKNSLRPRKVRSHE